MNEDRQVRAWRHALGVKGYPSASHVWRLAALMENEVIVEVSPVLCAYTVEGRDGRQIVSIPDRLNEDAAADALLEEIGHWWDESGLKPALPGGRTKNGRHRLACLGDDRAESRASALVLAWKLPLDVISLTASPERIAAESGCPVEMVRERLALVSR
jgi:hypothetical protein